MPGLYQRIRPRTFSGVVGQDATVRLIQAQPRTGVFFPVNLFIGEHGCGKTTVAEIMAMAANCRSLRPDGSPCLECDSCRAVLSGTCGDIHEIDAASNNGVDFVRLFTEQASYLPMMLKRRVFILDEVHMLSQAAFNALLKLFENVPEHCLFILCTTDPQKIPQTVRSRCHSYTFGCISTPTIRDYLVATAEREGYDIEPDACTVIARNACGAMRDALVLLEQVTITGGRLTASQVSELLGASDDRNLCGLLHAILGRDDRALITASDRYAAEGRNFETLTRELLSLIRDVKTAWWGGNVFGTDEYREMLSGFRKYPAEAINELTMLLYDARKALHEDPVQTSFDVQMTLVTTRLAGILSAGGVTRTEDTGDTRPGRGMREPVPDTAPAVEVTAPVKCGDVDLSEFFLDDDGPAEEGGVPGGGLTGAGFTPSDGPGGFECPGFLAGAGDCEAVRQLTELCRTDRVFCDTMRTAVRGYADGRGGMILVATDSAAYSCVAVTIGRKNIKNVTIRKTTVA